MKRGLAGLLVAVAMFAAPQVMTNQIVEAMISGGVPLTTIVSAIRTAARIQLSETKQDYERLIAAGASPAAGVEIMKAIHHRQYVGVDHSPVETVVPPVQPAPIQATAPVQRTVIPSSTTPVVAPVTAAPVPAATTATAVTVHAPYVPEKGTDPDRGQNSFTPAGLGQTAGLSAAPAHAASAATPHVLLQFASEGTSRNAAKDLERDCPGVKITIDQQAADYTLLLNHVEVGFLARDIQIQVANKEGDLIAKTRQGGSIAGGMRRACELILQDWARK